MSAAPKVASAGAGGRHLVDIFLDTARRHRDDPAARSKRGGVWVATTWGEMEARARRYAAGLIDLGVAPGDRVALLGDTTLEWVVCELGAHMAGATSVPIYQTNPPAEVAYVLKDSGAVAVFGDTAAQVEKIVAVRGEVPDLKHVIRIFGEGGEGVLDLEALARRGDACLEKTPDAVDERVAGIDPDQAACFIYTSGTTGPPKGVVLTHANWAFEADCAVKLDLAEAGDEGFLFLPMAHSFAQVLKTVWFKLGHPLAFAESIEKIVSNIGEVRPTMMASVPRIFEKVFAKVVAGGFEAPGVKGRLFRWAMGEFDRYAEARQAGRSYDSLQFALARRLVFSKVASRLKAAFGGRMRFFISGGAPLAPKIAYFFDLAGIVILEGYGMTESSAGATMNRPGHNKIGTVGQPFPGVEIRIAEDGEILIRGPNVMKGYHGKPEATAETVDEDCWLHTGDIGEVDAEGFVRITDRKKDLIITAGGKNVAPQNIENQLKTHPLVSQVVVHGDKRKFLSALVTLDPEGVHKWAADHGVPMTPLEEMAGHPGLVAEIQSAIDELNGRLAAYETLKKFAVLPVDFTQESGELTPTMKVKRRVVEKRHQAILDRFYDEKF